ncbi:hypothetical protein E2C01_056051 [Portunus trituberculatus]|uniref:Uncharacterized protein n=1 Tax=Portunus trituberculatus TaxID=210409 RepID=A0A5B7GT20_PORTR|nr:hypothetical protein [Portunus trituberculatus]
MHGEWEGADLAIPQNRADRSKFCEISKPACWKMGAKAEQYPLMDGKEKCFVSHRKIKKSTKFITGRDKMTTPRLTPTTEDRPLCPINYSRGLSDLKGHKGPSVKSLSFGKDAGESPHMKVKCPWRLVEEVVMRLVE